MSNLQGQLDLFEQILTTDLNEMKLNEGLTVKVSQLPFSPPFISPIWFCHSFLQAWEFPRVRGSYQSSGKWKIGTG